jgi:hypothetical protein
MKRFFGPETDPKHPKFNKKIAFTPATATLADFFQ